MKLKRISTKNAIAICLFSLVMMLILPWIILLSGLYKPFYIGYRYFSYSNIFEGLVERQLSEENIDGKSSTQFLVEIGENYKGRMPPEVTVDVINSSSEAISLSTGYAYRFYTQYDKQKDSYVITKGDEVSNGHNTIQQIDI